MAGPARADVPPVVTWEAPVPPAQPDLPSREAAEAAEARGDWPVAFLAWQACAVGGRDAAWCARRAELLAPQAADGFTGHAALDAVRRDYLAQGSAEATRRIEAAAAANPSSPAIPEMYAWLANEADRNGDPPAAARWRALAEAHADTSPTTRQWLGAQADAERRTAQERTWTLGLAVVAGVYLVAGLTWRRAPLAARQAAIAAGLLGVVPMGFAWVWGGDLDVLGFGRTGLAAAAGVLVAPRLPRWAAAVGTAALVLAVAGWNGWLPSLGLVR